MYTSDISVATLVGGIEGEITVFPTIKPDNFYSWYNALMNMLYGEVIRDKVVLYTYPDEEDGTVDIQNIPVPDSGGIQLPQDIDKVYLVGEGGKRRYIARSEYTDEANLFNNTYYIRDNRIHIKSDMVTAEYVVIYAIYKPQPVTAKNAVLVNVELPIEFHDMIRAKLRGEAYKMCNEDSLAAKWFGEYNAALEDFKLWQQRRRPKI